MERARWLLVTTTVVLSLWIGSTIAAATRKDAFVSKKEGDIAKKEVEVITVPRPGEEYVFVKSERSQPTSSPSGAFSTSHQIPSIQEKQKKTKQASEEYVRFTTSHKVTRPTHAPIKEHKKILKVISNDPTEKKRETRQTDASELEVAIEDEGQTGVIDEYEKADAEERKILARKAEPIVRKSSEKKETNLKPKPVQEEPEEDEEEVVYEDEENPPKPAVETRSRTPSRVEQEEVKVPTQKFVSSSKATETSALNTPVTRGRNEDKYEIVSVSSEGKAKKLSDEGTYDFVDTPLTDKVLTPSGTSQASRVNVKKGPNGQDYEYEYVYYYYDEEDEPGKGGSKASDSSKSGATPSPVAKASPTTIRQNIPTEPAPVLNNVRGRRPEYSLEEDEQVPSAATRGSSKQRYTTIERTRGQGEQVNVPTTPEPASNEVLPQTRGGNRNRGRQLPASSAEETVPVSEERLPANTRFPPRSRSNHNSSPSSTTPSAQTDTPITRVRGTSGSVRRPSLELVDSSSFRTHASDVSPDQDQIQPQPFDGADFSDAVPRGQVRQRTRTQQPAHQLPSQVTDEGTLRVAVIPQQLGDPSRIPTGTTRVQDLEEYVQPVQPQRQTVRQRISVTQPTEIPTFVATDVAATTENTLGTTNYAATVKEAGMTDKAAFDLYAILQQTQNEEANSLTGEPLTTDDDPDHSGTTDIDQVSFTQVPTTVIVTQPPTTTTTTTTTTPEPTTTALPQAGGRVRYRGGNGGSRNRIRPSAGSTTTTTPEPEEGTTKRARFQPSRNRVEGQVSAYGRRGSNKKPVADQSESGSNVEEEVTPRNSGRGRYRSNNNRQSQNSPTTTEAPVTEARSRPSFGSADRYSPRRRNGNTRGSTTTLPHEEETNHEESADAGTTTARPTRPRLNIGGGARPLRPGPKINIGGRGKIGGPSTQPTISLTESDPSTSPLTEETPSGNDEQAAEVSTPPPNPLTRLRNRPRLHVGEKQAVKPQPAAPQPANRRQLVSGLLPKRRPGQAAEVTSELPPEDEKPVEERHEEEGEAIETSPTIASTTEQPPTPENKLSSLIGNRRRIGGRRPGTLISRPNPEE